MDNHKKLFVGALLITVVATGASASAYLTSVSQSSKAATREDVQKMVADLRASQATVKSPIVPKLTTEKSVLKSAGTADLKTQSSTVDKTKLHAEFTNTTGTDLKGAKVIFKVTGKSKFALGTPAGATLTKGGPKLKPGYISYTLPDLKPGQIASVDVPFIVRTSGATMKVTSILQVPGSKTTATQPVTIQSN